MKNLQRIVIWLASTSIFILVFYFGLVRGVEGAANVAKFYVWLVFLVSWYTLSDDAVRAARKKGSSPVPVWVQGSVDLAAVCLMIWYGWFWSAGAYLISMLLLSRLRGPMQAE